MKTNTYQPQIKVSVLVPIYNSQRYLRECIESILNQSLREIEIILLDDGSTDCSSEICDDYARKDERVKVIHKINSGYGATMNVGLGIAMGKYVGFVESDDYILPGMYETLYKIAEEQQAEIVKSNYRRFYGEGSERNFENVSIAKHKNYYNRISNTQLEPNWFRINNINCNGLFRRDFIEEYHIRFNETPDAAYQDNGFWFQTFCLSKRIYLVSPYLYMVRRDNPNSSVKSKSKVYCICDEYEFIGDFLEMHPEFPLSTRKMYYRMMYGNYLWTLKRISDDFKAEFIDRFSRDFQEPLRQGFITTPEFSNREISTIQKIVNHPQKYYHEISHYKSYRSSNLLKSCLFFPYYMWLRAKLRRKYQNERGI